MATKSILKNVDIREKKLGKNLVEALESAVDNKKRYVIHTGVTCEEVTKDKLKEIFG